MLYAIGFGLVSFGSDIGPAFEMVQFCQTLKVKNDTTPCSL